MRPLSIDVTSITCPIPGNLYCLFGVSTHVIIIRTLFCKLNLSITQLCSFPVSNSDGTVGSFRLKRSVTARITGLSGIRQANSDEKIPVCGVDPSSVHAAWRRSRRTEMACPISGSKDLQPQGEGRYQQAVELDREGFRPQQYQDVCQRLARRHDPDGTVNRQVSSQ